MLFVSVRVAMSSEVHRHQQVAGKHGNNEDEQRDIATQTQGWR